jgi:hypothetical protein
MNQEALSHKAKNPKHETMNQEALSHKPKKTKHKTKSSSKYEPRSLKPK